MKRAVYFVTLATISQISMADDKTFAIGLNGGLRGVGVELVAGINESLNVRGSFSQIEFDESFDESDVEYDGDLELQTTGILLDYYPFKPSFHVSIGYFINGSQLRAVAQPQSGSVEINGFDYDLSGERVSAKADWDSGAPYAGLGWGNPLGEGSAWTVTLNLGVIFSGEPEVGLTASQGLYETADVLGRDLQADIDAEEAELNDELDDYDFLPVVQMGVTYSF